MPDVVPRKLKKNSNQNTHISFEISQLKAPKDENAPVQSVGRLPTTKLPAKNTFCANRGEEEGVAGISENSKGPSSLPCSWMVCSLSFCLFPRPMKPLGSHGLTLGPTLCNKLLPENVSFRVNPLDFVSIFHSVHFSFPSLLPCLPVTVWQLETKEDRTGAKQGRKQTELQKRARGST